MSSITLEKNKGITTGDKPDEHENDTEEVSTQGEAEHETEPVTTEANFPGSQSSTTAETETSPSVGSKPKQKRKPRAKRELTQKELEQRRKAAKNRAKTLTKEHQTKAGRLLLARRATSTCRKWGQKAGK